MGHITFSSSCIINERNFCYRHFTLQPVIFHVFFSAQDWPPSYILLPPNVLCSNKIRFTWLHRKKTDRSSNSIHFNKSRPASKCLQMIFFCSCGLLSRVDTSVVKNFEEHTVSTIICHTPGHHQHHLHRREKSQSLNVCTELHETQTLCTTYLPSYKTFRSTSYT